VPIRCLLVVVLATASAEARSDTIAEVDSRLWVAYQGLAETAPRRAFRHAAAWVECDPDSALAACAVADACYRLPRFPAALRATRQLVARFPEHPMAWGLHARILARIHLPEDALRAAEESLSRDPREAFAMSALVLAFDQLDDPARAHATWTRLIARADDVADPYVQRARARHDLQDFSGERSDLTRALELDPEHALAWRLLAHLKLVHDLDRSGHDALRYALRLGLEAPGEAFFDFAGVRPTRWQARALLRLLDDFQGLEFYSVDLARAAALIELDRTREAKQLLYNLQGYPFERNERWLLLARAQIQSGVLTEALSTYETLYGSPGEPASAEQPDTQAAREATRLSLYYLKRNPRDPRPLRAALRWVELAPDSLFARYTLARTWRLMGHVDAALAEVERSLRDAHRASDYYAAGQLLHLQGDMLLEQGDEQAAFAAYARSLDAHDSATLRVQRAGLWRARGKIDAARHDLLRATQLYPWEERTWVTLMRLELSQGRLEAAKKAAWWVQALRPDHPMAEEAQRVLER